MPEADDQLKNWFNYLRTMRTDAATLSNDTAAALDQFARQKPADLFPTPEHQAQYAQLINRDTKLVVTAANVASASSALDLLTTIYQPLDPFVLGVFQAAAGDHTTLPIIFRAKLASLVYPTPDSRGQLLIQLQNDMDATWLPAAKQQKLQNLLIDPAATVQQCVSLACTL